MHGISFKQITQMQLWILKIPMARIYLLNIKLFKNCSTFIFLICQYDLLPFIHYTNRFYQILTVEYLWNACISSNGCNLCNFCIVGLSMKKCDFHLPLDSFNLSIVSMFFVIVTIQPKTVQGLQMWHSLAVPLYVSNIKI